jgi:hypothetical protein
MQTDRVFTASVWVIAFDRVRPVLFVAAGGYLAWLVTAGGQLLSDIHRMPFLKLLLLTLITVGPAFLAWVTWRRVPWGATGGLMRIGASGVEYRVGPDRIRTDWTRIDAVRPVPMARHTDLLAVWLPVRADTETVAPTDAELRKVLHGAAYRPVQRPDGLLLPVELFGTAGAAQILATLRGHLEQTRPDG